MATYFIQNTNNVEDIEQMNNVINKVNKVNTEATSNIGQLTDLNNKAQELSNNINQALPLNSELVRNTESAKVTNTNLAATNQEATTKNTELQASLEEAKKYIAGLDGSQNIPQIRLDVDALQNGLKSNQALSYEGSSIVANETLEGRTEGMRICGRTLVNLLKEKIDFISSSNSPHTGQKKLVFATSPNKPFTFIADIKYTGSLPTQLFVRGNKTDSTFVEFGSIEITSNLNGKIVCVCKQNIDKGCSSVLIGFRSNSDNSTIKNAMILEGDWTNKEIPSYFEGLKSFGEAEKVEDKYKISILSSGKNLTNCKFELGIWNVSPTDQEPNKQSNSNYVRSSELIDISKFNDQQISISLNGKSVEGNIKYYTKDRKYIKDVFNAPFNPVPNAFYITIHVPLSRFSKYDEFQIETGSNSTSYEPYKCDKKDILIKEPLRENDIMYEDNGQVKVNRYARQYTFTGNESIRTFGLTDETTELGFEFLDFKLGFKPVENNFPNAISNRFKVYSTVYSESSYEGIALNQNGNTYIRISKDKLSTPDVNGIKAWLKANPTTIVYQLSEPVVEIVENCVDIDLDTFQEKTYFSIENSLLGTLDFKVPSNIGSVVQNMAKEVNNIWDVINNLLVPSLIDINKNVAMSTIKNNLK